MIELTTCKFHLKCLLNESQYINDTIGDSIKDIKSDKLPNVQALYSCQEYISKMKESLEYVLKEIEKEYDRLYEEGLYRELPLKKEPVQQTIDDMIAQAEYNAPLINCPICNSKLVGDENYCPHCGDSWIALDKGGI